MLDTNCAKRYLGLQITPNACAMISCSCGHFGESLQLLCVAERITPIMGTDRSNLSCRTLLLLLVLLGIPLAARADTLEDSARELAGKIAADLPAKENISCELRNVSSLQPEEVARIDEALKTDLQNEGFPAHVSSAETARILVTLSENLNNFVWAAEIRQGDASRVVFTMIPRPRENVVPVMAGQVAASATGSVPQHPGGILRVQMSQRVSTIDPRQWPPGSVQEAASERVDYLIFDRLIRFDDHGSVQPALAISWQHDAQSRSWEFRLRTGVKFSDGAEMTPEIAALALQQLLGNAFDVSANSDSVIIQANHSMPDLLAQLAAGRYFIFHTATDGGIFGTGPFRVSAWPSGAGAKAVLSANESCWAGRPFVDTVELTMGVTFDQQANALLGGRADVVELPASQVRRAVQRGERTSSSNTVELFVLQFNTGKLEIQDEHLRQAISLAIDRTSIADVILQRQGAPAAGLLPNWLSGYAFLFPDAEDLPRAKDLIAATGREVSRPTPLVLVYDSDDVDARAAAERVAVNLREAGIVVHTSGQIAGVKNPAVDMRLVRIHIATPDTGLVLAGVLTPLGEPPTSLETIDQEYAAERAPIDAFRVVPLVHVTESYGLSPQVRDWMPPNWGGWRLENVWLDQSPGAGEKSQ